MYVCVCECVRVRVRVYVCLHECSVQQMIHKYIFLALVSSRSIMCTYSILFTLTVGVCHVLPLSLFLLQQSTGGIVNNIMVSWLMNPWVKKDANVPVICRLSGDNRQDIVKWQVADSTEGFRVSVEEGRDRWESVAGSPKGKERSKTGLVYKHKNRKRMQIQLQCALSLTWKLEDTWAKLVANHSVTFKNSKSP